jgi:type I site-specific restriction endonuclease
MNNLYIQIGKEKQAIINDSIEKIKKQNLDTSQVENILNKILKGQNILIKSCTGSGKTYTIMTIITELCKYIKLLKFLIVSPSNLIRDKLADHNPDFSTHGMKVFNSLNINNLINDNQNLSKFKSGKFQSIICNSEFAASQIAKNPNDYVYIVLDESHRLDIEWYFGIKLLCRYYKIPIIQLSATPSDDKIIENVIEILIPSKSNVKITKEILVDHCPILDKDISYRKNTNIKIQGKCNLSRAAIEIKKIMPDNTKYSTLLFINSVKLNKLKTFDDIRKILGHKKIIILDSENTDISECEEINVLIISTAIASEGVNFLKVQAIIDDAFKAMNGDKFTLSKNEIIQRKGRIRNGGVYIRFNHPDLPMTKNIPEIKKNITMFIRFLINSHKNYSNNLFHEFFRPGLDENQRNEMLNAIIRYKLDSKELQENFNRSTLYDFDLRAIYANKAEVISKLFENLFKYVNQDNVNNFSSSNDEELCSQNIDILNCITCYNSGMWNNLKKDILQSFIETKKCFPLNSWKIIQTNHQIFNLINTYYNINEKNIFYNKNNVNYQIYIYL